MTTSGRNPRALGHIVKAALAAGMATAASAATSAAADSCSALATTFHRPNTTISTAQTVPAGTFVAPATPSQPPQPLPGLPQFCRVTGFTTPTSDSHIGFEVWMPEPGWNGKYVQEGCGGLCGSISMFYGAMAEPLRRGYAVAATDLGHQSSSPVDASWAMGHPQRVIDFGYRGLKETTDVAKAIIMAFKWSGPRRSYFSGCSDGGREALMEAQRFPHDFDGIVAGTPANFLSHLQIGGLWNYLALTATPDSELSQADVDLLSTSVLEQCAGHDGGLSTDKFLNNPRACHFKPEKLSCNGNIAGSCLTSAKVEAVKKIYVGAPGIFPGYGPGAEANDPANWPTWLLGNGNPTVALQTLIAQGYFQNIVFPNSGWTLNSFSVEENAREADRRTGAILNAVDPNLRAFKSHGGKLIHYFGWADPAISPWNSVNYYRSVVDEMGGSKETEEFYRLFPAPGVGHCNGGAGPNAFGQALFDGPNPSDPADDLLSALDYWVELGVAPEKIIATKYVNDDPSQGVAFQRPLCPFPKIAKYKGRGDTMAASSFECVWERLPEQARNR